MSAQLRRELWWLALGLLGASSIGFVLGSVLLPAAAFLLIYALWMLHRLSQLIDWLTSGGKASQAPDTVGLMDEVVRLVHTEKRYSRKQRKRYRAILAQFHGLASELPDGILVLDNLQQIRWSNTAARTLLGVSTIRDKGQRIGNLIRDPDFLAYLHGTEHATELELTLTQDTTKTLAIQIVPPEKGMSVMIARDISQRVRTREMRRAFVGNVSHELRTPLTVIQGYLELIMDDETLPQPLRNALSQVSSQSSRMTDIVEHLLELSRLEDNPLADHEGDAVQVATLIEALVCSFKRGGDVTQQVELSVDHSLSLLGSETELYSACQNIVVNALKYTPANARIAITWQANAEDQPVFEVSDDGPGIDEHHLPYLSERFYRVDKARSRDSGGTGLGLAIVKHVAQRHGGQLQIESETGRGSVFRIVFPSSRAVREPAVAGL